jgi:hypothetical protein
LHDGASVARIFMLRLVVLYTYFTDRGVLCRVFASRALAKLRNRGGILTRLRYRNAKGITCVTRSNASGTNVAKQNSIFHIRSWDHAKWISSGEGLESYVPQHHNRPGQPILLIPPALKEHALCKVLGEFSIFRSFAKYWIFIITNLFPNDDRTYELWQ